MIYLTVHILDTLLYSQVAYFYETIYTVQRTFELIQTTFPSVKYNFKFNNLFNNTDFG